MSITINLLPWREVQRERQTRKFYLWVAFMLLLGVVIGLLAAQYYQHRLAAQQQRNTYISDHIARLNADIDGLSRYQSDIGRLAEQIAVFQALQSERLQTVQLFIDVADSVANDVIYQQLLKTGNSISATAIAANERQVSEQLRRIAALPGFGVPSLSAVESNQQGVGRVFRFNVEHTALEHPDSAQGPVL
ncbi:unnamed protein product [Ectocarpus sp. 12 AP-2014]